ncbi:MULTISPECIES: hypothetical protein [unclassified Microcoleus]|uniref:hypothetical protein n=1 Tax=unclassified Microcoleus TaxID=2642155 RepID=UPI001DF108DE|nr:MULTISPECIES: hypothetical protein [unclassified Microcoleus]MCC3600065.1 hypothetical protein [Microcoleus sp. PH2017_26_ELK_O_A]MCC3625081.1 hypothetical protein [Microcoleus sp. PH2017_36_ELK_O_B]
MGAWNRAKTGKIMKLRSPLTITLSLAILAATSLPIIAQAVRFPTDAELQQLIEKFRRFAASPPGGGRGLYSTDRRDRIQIQQLTSFVKAWSQIDPATAPFLGKWTAWEETKSIYPSNLKGRVCIIDGFIPSENNIGFRFGIGTVSNGRIKTDNYLLIHEKNYLGGIFVYNNEPGIYEYAWPKPLTNPSQLMRNVPLAKRNQLLQQFKEAECTASLPKK